MYVDAAYIVTDRVAWSVGRSVTLVSPAKTAEPIDLAFGSWTRVGRRKHHKFSRIRRLRLRPINVPTR